MRPLHDALAAAIALAFAAGPSAAATTTTTTSTTPRATPSIATSTNGTFVNNAPAMSAQSSGSTSSTVTTTTTTNSAVSPPNATTVDTRNQQTLAATAGTHASGSTSAIDNLLAQGAASANTSTTGSTGRTTAGNGAVVTAPLISGYVYGNPSDVTALPYAPNTAPVNVASNATLGSDVIANAQVVQVDNARADANVSRAIAQVQRDRKRIGRNGQLLYSIAPRTNVDRSAEMPDDGPPPSLTGSYSTLAR